MRGRWWLMPVVVVSWCLSWSVVRAGGSGREEVNVRLVQVPFVVVDPGAGGRGAVRGIGLEDLRVRIDGEEVSAEQRGEMKLDEVCGPGSVPPVGEGGPRGRLLVLVADFNYLDTRGRELVARALEALADRVEQEGAGSWRYKVYGITREVVPFTAGATADPADLRLAARLVRLEYWTEPGAGEGPDLVAEIDWFARGPATEFRRWVERAEARLGPRGPVAWPRGPGDLTAEELEDPDKQIEAESKRRLQAIMRQDIDLRRALPGRDADALDEFARAEADRAASGMFDTWADARQRHRPGASLAALRAILLANGDWPGWKGLVLYTSEGFRYADEQRQRMLMDRVLATARGSFVLWTVDTTGLTGVEHAPGAAALSVLPASLLTSLARETGGRVLRRTGDLARAWQELEERLSCYYLLSFPLAENAPPGEHRVEIRLDRSRRKELRGLRVEQPGRVLVESPRERLLRQRVAALLNPADFPRPRVRVEAAFPAGESLPVTIRVPLEDLAWEPFRGEGGGVIARVLVDAVVERVGPLGNEIECRVDAGRDGRLVAWLPRPPRPGDPRELLLRVPCTVKETGSRRLRAAVTDLVAREVGGGIGLALVPTEERADPGLVLEAASGRDLSWRPGAKIARPDREREVFRRVDEGEVSSGDRLRLRWRACPGRAENLRLAILRLAGADGVPEVVQVLPRDRVAHRAGIPCPVAEAVMPAFSLEPGNYLFVLLEEETDPASWAGAWRSDAPFPAGSAGGLRVRVVP